MATSLNKKIKDLPKKRQEAIQKRANQLIEEEMTLRDLRLALEKTQAEMSLKLHIKQDGVSRLEHRSDMLLSTLKKYINAMGGTLKLTAEFPNRTPVLIQALTEIH
jgi:hypothetical protein